MKFLNNFSKRSRISLESIEFCQEISNEFSNNFQMYKGSTHANVTCLDLFNIKKNRAERFEKRSALLWFLIRNFANTDHLY